MTDLTVVGHDDGVTETGVPEAEVAETDMPRLPEQLLAPLLDTAGELLRSLDQAEVPPPLRPLTGFDRRGFARGPARQQLLRTVEHDSEFRQRVSRRFLERPEARVVLASWTPVEAQRCVDEAAERADLPLLASALYAQRPPGWSFGLGVVCATYERTRREKEEEDDTKALETQLSSLDEARRRAIAAVAEAQAESARLEQELREERHSRRAREDQAVREADAAREKAAELEVALANAQAGGEAAGARAEREARRARASDAELRVLRARIVETERLLAEKVEALERSAAPGTGLRYADLQALADAADLARRLAAGLGGVVEHVRNVMPAATPAPAATPPATAPPASPTRAAPAVPAGMIADSPEALEAMLRTPGAVLVVDGYNVSMRAWGEGSVADQRERLGAALAALHSRTRCDVTVVFDGADVGGALPVRRPGVRTLFSAPGQEADAVVVSEAAALPARVSVVVASSDHWVREHAESEGARVVSADTLLRALRA